MESLAQALNRFNRTEPDLLFRDAFGHSGAPMRLGESFRKRVANAAGIDVPSDAWWAAEYPFNSLAGALLVHAKGYNEEPQSNAPPLVKPGREDVDFLISFGHHLVLIEAKAYTANDMPQILRKLRRLQLLRDFYDGLEKSGQHPVEFHFLLASPAEPQKLGDVPWPPWACKGRIPPWMPLHMSLPPGGVLQVTRCHESGRSSSGGQSWRVLPAKVF